MGYKEIENILNRKVFFVRESTQKERKIFSDKKAGGFFTIGLESGQVFVSHFSEIGSGIKKQKKLIFRPLNHIIKGLEEVSYNIPDYIVGDFLCGGPQEAFKFTKDCPSKDQAFMMDLLEFARPGDMTFEHMENLPFLDKSLQVANAYFEKIRTTKKLDKILIPQPTKETNKTLTSIQKIKSTRSR